MAFSCVMRADLKMGAIPAWLMGRNAMGLGGWEGLVWDGIGGMGWDGAVWVGKRWDRVDGMG